MKLKPHDFKQLGLETLALIVETVHSSCAQSQR
jgi:hypothetical protein